MTIKQYFNFFLENFIIAFKSLIEFKANLINVIIVHIFQIFTIFVFGYVFINSIGNVIGWTFFEYLLFIVCLTISYSLFAHNFFSFKFLNREITSGNLNQYLFRPGNPLVKYFIMTKFSVVVYLINVIFYMILLIFFYKYNVFLIIYSLPLLFLIALAYLIVYFILESISFYFLELGRSLRNTLDQEIVRRVLYFYPANFFEASNLKYFFMLIPISYIATEVVPILSGEKNSDYSIILILAVIIIVGIIILNFMWKKGLEKYEAFG